MIKIEVDSSGDVLKLLAVEIEGVPTDIVSELSLGIQAIHQQFYDVNPRLAEIFKYVMSTACADPKDSMWKLK